MGKWSGLEDFNDDAVSNADYLYTNTLARAA
jgi:hypothetical protein